MMNRQDLGTNTGVVSNKPVKAVLVIKQNSFKENPYWRNLWSFRELLLFLAWRDLLVRYKQTLLGVTWVVIRPLLTMVILTVVFGYIANLPAGGVPYPLVVFSGLLPWFFFSTALTEVSNSLIANGHLLSKVYFPRLIIPASTVLVSSVDFIVSTLVLFLLMLWFGVHPTWRLLLLPLLGLWVAMLSFGLGLWFSALNVKYRDFRHIVPFILQLGIYASPVAYSTSIVSGKLSLLYYLNPMAGIIDIFRWSITGQAPTLYGTLCALAFTVMVLVGGQLYFRSVESYFADDL
jgi:lipopolysaccharide transport system permease protein